MFRSWSFLIAGEGHDFKQSSADLSANAGEVDSAGATRRLADQVAAWTAGSAIGRHPIA